ncbi:sulfotransferase [Sinimarinibacterium flocculans]|uniref:Sulfotransferase family protein n=1 Tax=Sinimarinibacterium flocculans TaxID=985250 RepID=A0A318EDZ3_9GAMM|nr:sulfotransferase [Sinimarinibacterium flocculans]PXV70292.1 sulfotransferase family protein [Sinimarinibacterium flocculans]
MSAPPPLFILAAPFCGASYAAGCLGVHPRLYAVPELCLQMADAVGELLEIFHLSQGPQADGLLRTIAQLEFGAQHDDAVAAAHEWLAQRADWTTARLLAEIAARVAPRRLVVPDTEAPLRPLDLRRLHRGFPQAGILQLTRHPWTQGCLLDAWARDRLFVPPDFKDHAFIPALVDPQVPWLRCNRNIETVFAGRARCLRVEDVETPDDAALARLCELAGVDADALAAMREPERWIYAGFGPGAAPYGLEADVLERFDDEVLQQATAATLTAPLPWRPDGAGFDAQLVERARRYGYR